MMYKVYKLPDLHAQPAGGGAMDQNNHQTAGQPAACTKAQCTERVATTPRGTEPDRDTRMKTVSPWSRSVVAPKTRPPDLRIGRWD